MQGENAIWDGCQAGLTSIGIEADGVIKGCPSLPTAAYTGGNIRDHSLRDLLETAELNINANMGTPAAADPLWGFCRTCDYAELCRGGCTWTRTRLLWAARQQPLLPPSRAHPRQTRPPRAPHPDNPR